MFVHLFFALPVSIRWRLLFPTLCSSINTKSMVIYYHYIIAYCHLIKSEGTRATPLFFLFSVLNRQFPINFFDVTKILLYMLRVASYRTKGYRLPYGCKILLLSHKEPWKYVFIRVKTSGEFVLGWVSIFRGIAFPVQLFRTIYIQSGSGLVMWCIRLRYLSPDKTFAKEVCPLSCMYVRVYLNTFF
jgi:hypothetical protein